MRSPSPGQAVGDAGQAEKLGEKRFLKGEEAEIDQLDGDQQAMPLTMKE